MSQTAFPSMISQARLEWRPDQQITLRTRQPGDRFMPRGLDGHSQTIKKWMIDHKVPQVIRNEIPLLIIDNEIAAFMVGPQWIYHERFKADKGSQMVIYAVFKQKSTT
jgi:tRNA(Ile)-lysidine synthetase-like protein